MKKYNFQGWAGISRAGFFPIHYEENIDWNVLVTDSYEIRIYLDKEHCNDEEKIYHKYHTSAQGFTMGKIFKLINETYIKFIDTFYDGDEGFISNLALKSFEFDEETNCVYPICTV